MVAQFGSRGRILLALLLTLFVLAPSFDFECAAEGMPSAASSTLTAPPTAIRGQPRPARDTQHAPGLCPHGHCHTISIAGQDAPALAPSLVVRPVLPLWVTTAALTSATSTRLDRPPRA